MASPKVLAKTNPFAAYAGKKAKQDATVAKTKAKFKAEKKVAPKALAKMPKTNKFGKGVKK